MLDNFKLLILPSVSSIFENSENSMIIAHIIISQEEKEFIIENLKDLDNYTDMFTTLIRNAEGEHENPIEKTLAKTYEESKELITQLLIQYAKQ